MPCFPYRDFRRQFSEMEHRKLSVRTDEVEAFDEVNIFLFDGLSNAFTLLITRCCYVHCYRCRIQQKQVWSANKRYKARNSLVKRKSKHTVTD